MVIIGICGGTSSGKSSVAQKIKKDIACSCEILGQDCYYIDQGSKPFEERRIVNYDEPDIFEHNTLLADVNALIEGRSINRKGYDYENHRRADTNELIAPPDVLIIEGIHALYDKKLRQLMDLKIYVSVDADTCLIRRIRRDIAERGRETDNILTQYEKSVKPAFDKYIRNYEAKADISINNNRNYAVAVEMIIAYAEKKAAEGKK